MMKWLCMRASTVTHANAGVFCVMGQPCIQNITGEAADMFEGKPPWLGLLSTACTDRIKLDCSLLHPLKGQKGPIVGAIKPFYEVFYWVIWTSCAECTESSVAVSSLWTCSAHLLVQRGSSSGRVSPPRCKSLPPQTPCRGPRCGWWSSGSHTEASHPSGHLHWRRWPSASGMKTQSAETESQNTIFYFVVWTWQSCIRTVCRNTERSESWSFLPHGRWCREPPVFCKLSNIKIKTEKKKHKPNKLFWVISERLEHRSRITRH